MLFATKRQTAKRSTLGDRRIGKNDIFESFKLPKSFVKKIVVEATKLMRP